MRLRQLLNMSGGFPELTLDLLRILLTHSQTLKREKYNCLVEVVDIEFDTLFIISIFKTSSKKEK